MKDSEEPTKQPSAATRKGKPSRQMAEWSPEFQRLTPEKAKALGLEEISFISFGPKRSSEASQPITKADSEDGQQKPSAT